MKKFISIPVALLVIGSLALTASNVSAAKTGATAPPKLKTGVTLTIWDFFGAQQTAEYGVEKKIANQWAKATKNHVNVVTNLTSTNTKMCTAGPAGQGPDLIGTPHDQVPGMVQCGTIAAVPAWAWTPASKKTYVAGALKATTYNGKSYSMPWAVETTGMFYNKALIPASQFKPPKGQKRLTWGTLIPRLKKYASQHNVVPFGWDPGNFYYDYAFVTGGGGYVFKYTKKGYDYKQLGLDSAGTVKGAQFAGSLSTKGKYNLIPSDMTGSNGDGLFGKGQELVDWTGPWNEASFTQQNIKYGFAPMPALDAKHPMRTFSGYQVYAINKFSKHVNEAASLLAYLTKNMQLPAFKASGRIPVIKSIINGKQVKGKGIAGQIAQAALNADPIPAIPEMNYVWSPAGAAFGNVFQGKQPASDAMKGAQTQVAQDIAKAHGG